MKTTEQNNRLIAEFLGNKIMEDFDYDGDLLRHNNLRFHLSWDWLMPVIEKIEKLDYIKVESNYQNVENDWQCLIVKGNDIIIQEFDFNHIDAMYQAVVQFIEWYNEQK